MIKIDVSKAIPRRLGTYLLGVIPGVVFELAVAFGNPIVAHQAIGRVTQVYAFQPWALIVLFLASCLIVGQTFFLLAWFTDWALDFIYRTLRYLIFHSTLGSDWLYRTVGKLQGVPPNRKFRFLWRPIMWARARRFPFTMRPMLRCQRMAAAQILKRKYGVTPSKGQWEWVDQEWQVWLAILGKAPSGFRESFVTMRTFLGCGLAELAALCFVPSLQNRYFATMTCVLLAAGCFQSISFVRLRGEPNRAAFTRLRILMEELSELAPAKSKEPTGSEPTFAISAGGKDDIEEDQ